MVVIVVKRYAVRDAEKMAVRSTQGQNRAVRRTQGGRGVSPSQKYQFLLIKLVIKLKINR